MKKLYDTAISKTPDISKYGVKEEDLSKEELEKISKILILLFL